MEAQRLVAKLNAGQCFTDSEITWAYQNDPSLWSMISGKPCTTPAPVTTTNQQESARLVAKLNAGGCFSAEEIAWANQNDPSLWTMIYGKPCKVAPPPTVTPPVQCPPGQSLVDGKCVTTPTGPSPFGLDTLVFGIPIYVVLIVAVVLVIGIALVARRGPAA